MKPNIFLWIGAVIICVLALYYYSITNEDFPISGTFSIDGKKVTYQLDKSAYGDKYTTGIRTDDSNLTGSLLWQDNSKVEWVKVPLIRKDKHLIAQLPEKKSGSSINYKIILEKNNKNYFLLDNRSITLKYFGSISSFVKILYFSILFLLLTVTFRTALDYFNSNDKIKKLSLFTLAMAFLYTFAVTPLYQTFKYDSLKNAQIDFFQLFAVHSLIIFFILTISLIVIFNSRFKKLSALVSGILVLLVFLFIRY